MLRMRGQVQDSLVETRTEQISIRETVNELEIKMHNIKQAHIEEIPWDKHFQIFTAWGMDAGVWKEEAKFLKWVSIRHYLGAL
jgi:hypothetical protein